MTSEPGIEAIRAILRRIGLELAFVDLSDRGKVDGLADLVHQFGDALRSSGPPDEIAVAAAACRDWLATPAAANLAGRLATWHGWMEEAITAWGQQRSLPPWPAEFTDHAARPSAASPAATNPPAGPPQPGPRPRWRPTDHGAGDSVALLPPGADPEMMRLFCAEAEDLLGEIERATIVLEAAPDDQDVLATLFRGFHTLKGNAAVMRLAVLQRVAHEVESLLEAARRGTRPLDADAIDVVLAAADLFTGAVAEMGRQIDGQDAGRPIPLPVTALVARVQEVLASKPARTDPVAARMAASPVDVSASQREPAPVAGGPPPGEAVVAGDSATAASPTVRLASSAASVRVDTAKLDALIDLVGELVIAQSMVVQAAEHADQTDHLSRSLGQLRGITADLQRTAMAMRMVPVKGMFQKMSRLVRDTGVALGKDIRLVLDGEETEIDRTLIEELGDPLVHMIRNAVDHGIETPAERRLAGKPPTGTVALRAFHQGGHVVIEVADDGRGLDPDRIRRKAVERGLISRDASLDDRDTLDLIFAPGFSTAEQVTDVSGRGVGMDVVRRNLERIRGKVEIDSTPGQGTTFTISTPLTLAIIEGLIVAVAGQRFIIPTLSVRESFRPLPGIVSTVHGRGELVDVRGRQLPLLRLGRHLDIGGGQEPTQGIVVVLEAGHDRRGLLVDELLGKQEVVIKSLGETFAGRTDFAGAAILGDGRVGLILDTTSLVRLGKRATESAA